MVHTIPVDPDETSYPNMLLAWSEGVMMLHQS